MNKNSIFALPIILFLMAFTLPSAYTVSDTTKAPQGKYDPCQNTNNTFQHEERLTYKIYYNWNFVWLSAGEVTFRVFDEGGQYHYQAIGKTYKSYEWFFEVKDQYDSWVDKNTLMPNYSERSVNEGGYHIFEKISFNQAAKKTTVWRATKRGDPETKTEHEVKGCVNDVLSVLYNLRNIDFENQQAGFKVPFSVFMDKEEFPLQMRYVGKEPKKKIHGMGRYKTMKFQPDVIVGNVFKDDDKMSVWVSEDQNRIPLLIETPVSVGSVKMVLKDYWGLKYDFKAKVD